MQNENQIPPYRRIGNIDQCPACGVGINSEAYICPRCGTYFCFKCRRRVQRSSKQYQCVNQRCECHGKLLCNACVVPIQLYSQKVRREVVAPAIHVKVVPLPVNIGVSRLN